MKARILSLSEILVRALFTGGQPILSKSPIQFSIAAVVILLLNFDPACRRASSSSAVGASDL